MLLGALVLVALLVAAAGVSNAVLIAVTERTREIGLFRALGASPADISRLYWLETVQVCLARVTAGALTLGGRDVSRLRESELTRVRRDEIGFVFQHFGLVPTLTVAENVALPALFSRRQAGDRVEMLLRKVGLEHRRRHQPHELSGSEMQRVAIARALINEPRILLADEPTGNLDTATGNAVLALFEALRREGLTVILVTHNETLAACADRSLRLQDGRLNLVPAS